MELRNEDMFNQGSSGPSVMMNEKKKKPLSFMDVIDQVQKWRAIELEGVKLQTDRFTYKDRLEYMNVGMKHGMFELLFTLLLFPSLGFIIPDFIYFFTGHPVDLFKQILLISVALIPLVVYLMLCLTLASLYTGKITKIAILSLLMGRTVMIGMIGGFSIVFFYLIYKLSGFTTIGHYFVTFFSWSRYIVRTLPPERAYYSLLFYKLIRPSFFDLTIKSAIVYGLSALVPLFTVGCKAWYMEYTCKTKKS
ncbi:MAG: hypothetical protein ACYCSQ_00790 [bacterium]